MSKKTKASAMERPDNALSHNHDKHITKFEYVCLMLARIGGMFGTTLTGTLAAAFLHELYYGPVGVNADEIAEILAVQTTLTTICGIAFGFMAGSPAAIGLVMADKALKSANVSLLKFMTADKGTSHSNEVIIAFTGDTSAVKTAVLTAREVGLELITAMGEYPGGPSKPYLE